MEKTHTYAVTYYVTLTETEIMAGITEEDIVKRAIVGRKPKLAKVTEV